MKTDGQCFELLNGTMCSFCEDELHSSNDCTGCSSLAVNVGNECRRKNAAFYGTYVIERPIQRKQLEDGMGYEIISIDNTSECEKGF